MHVLHNGLTVLVVSNADHELLSVLMTEYQGAPMYSPVVAVVGGLAALVLFYIIHRMTRSDKNRLLAGPTLNVE